MPTTSTRSRLLPLFVLLASPCLAATARAGLPEPADFTAQYFVTDEAGEDARPMTDDDHQYFLNRARCECGQQVGVHLRMVNRLPDNTKRLEAFIGTMCAVAETTLAGEFKRCGRLASALGPTYEQGTVSTFHPVFLAHGVPPTSESRLPDDPSTPVAGRCEGQGEAGLWMCMPGENNITNCQKDEFYLRADDPVAALSGIPTLDYDFQPPLLQPTDLSVEPGNGSARLSWELPASGDIHGFRVLCEEAGSQASPGHAWPTPDLTERADHYLTARNLCGDQPFFDQALAAPEIADPNTCGNGVVEPGEACDDGEDNAAEGLCDPSCELRVGPSLHALDWDHVCSDHVAFTEDSVVIDSLTNGVAYNFVLVAYDRHGNPRALAQVVSATPDESLPDLVPAGDEGCNLTAGAEGHGLLTMSLATLGLLAVRRRRR